MYWLVTGLILPGHVFSIKYLKSQRQWSGQARQSIQLIVRGKRTSVLVALVSEHATRRIPLEDAYRQIDAYAAEQVDVGRDVRLSALFVGLLQTINMERNDIIAGIERFSRRQALLAERIKLATRKRTELRKNSAPDAAESEALAQIEKQIVWDSRIFDERNQLLFFVCQSPVILEKRLFALSRRIMSHLE